MLNALKNLGFLRKLSPTKNKAHSKLRKQGNKRIIQYAKVLLTSSLCLLLLLAANTVNIKLVSGVRTIHVRADFQTIQEAVNNATNGDTIEVEAGIYYEHVYINKSITLQGANSTTTIIDGTSNGAILRLETNDIYITGFTIRNAGTSHNGITSVRDKGTNTRHTIINNIITTSQHGVHLLYSNQNTITNNTFFDNFLSSIYLSSADRNDVIGNTISESPYGIRLLYSTDNTITGNTISQATYGIYLSDSSTDNDIIQNTVSGQTSGIYVGSDNNSVDHNTVTDSAYGIYIFNCETGTFNYNTLTNNSYGIRVFMLTLTTTDHTITNNKALHNIWAIELTRSRGNTFTGNWLQENTYGVYLQTSPYNTLYRNNFVRNIVEQASTNSINSWNMSGEGNYWSDYQGEDADGNGIGDTPYAIIPGYDYYPLMDTWSEHDISIENVALSKNATYAGSIINITVTVKNNGKISPPTSETFNVTVKYDLNIIETKPVVNLAQEANTTLTFNWNTTGLVPGNYTISAEASIVLDELNTDNNIFIDGTMRIKVVGDINGDGTVNIDDLVLLTQAFGSTLTSPNWNSDADLNKDNLVNALDLYLVGNSYDQTS